MFFKLKIRSNASLWYDIEEYFIWRDCAKLQKMGYRKPDVAYDAGQGPKQGLWLGGL
uniref:Uncharacterized protein n=1 Tax=viral metagenome TaxID=1070528 RepID=A0A6H1ZUD2_9ZZZZ